MNVVFFVAITASWCGPCQQFHRDWGNDARIEFVDIDQQPAVAERHGVRVLPTVIAMRDGREIGRYTGYRGRRELETWMQSMEGKTARNARRMRMVTTGHDPGMTRATQER